MTNDTAMSDLVMIGETGRPHGLAGALKIRPVTNVPNRFAGLRRVILESEDGRQTWLTIRRVRTHSSWSIVSFHELTSLEEAMLWTRAKVKIPQETLGILPDGQYYHFDLLGMNVFTESGRCIGAIDEIVPTGSNDVFVVTQQNVSHLIPSTEEVVRHVDVRGKRMVIRPIEGLFSA